MSEEELTKLGEYVLLEKLGHGGMATVYRGERTGEAGFRKTVAIKRMLPQYRRSGSLLERFAAEARTNARLDHPNLVSVADFGIEPEPYLVMEYVDGVTLAALLQRLVKKQHPLEIAAACFIGAEAAQGLDHAHRKRDESGNPLGIVHRDVSPQNILLSNEGAVKVSDFGLVKAADNVVQTGTGVAIGKLSYMAPEQANHQEVDARADVFSLGVVIWEMLAMRVLISPHDPARAAQKLQTCQFAPPSEYRPEVPPELDAIVMACLTKDPTARTPSAQALGMALRELLHELAPGYGRDPLARMLRWAFPERGWHVDEPYSPPKQPSVEERLSIPPAPAMRRAKPEGAQPGPHTQVNVPRADPMVTGPHRPLAEVAIPKQKRRTKWLWLGLGAAVLAALALFVLLGGLFLYSRYAAAEVQDGAAGGPRPTRLGSQTAPASDGPTGPGLMVRSARPGAQLYRGPRLLGALPLFLSESEMVPPLVVVATGYDAVSVDPSMLRTLLLNGESWAAIELPPSTHPVLAVWVSIDGEVWSGERPLGAAPAMFLVPPVSPYRYPELQVGRGLFSDRFDSVTIELSGCNSGTVCVRPGGT